MQTNKNTRTRRSFPLLGMLFPLLGMLFPLLGTGFPLLGTGANSVLTF